MKRLAFLTLIFGLSISARAELIVNCVPGTRLSDYDVNIQKFQTGTPEGVRVSSQDEGEALIQRALQVGVKHLEQLKPGTARVSTRTILDVKFDPQNPYTFCALIDGDIVQDI